MTCVSYYAGLRPSEVLRLRPQALTLPATGWGRIEVTEADDGYDASAEPKTGYRKVPIPPILVTRLTEWIDLVCPRDSSPLLFRTRNDKPPTLSNWNRSLSRASIRTGHAPVCPYDCRHACATTWLSAGVGLGEVALRLGHSVETLAEHYVGALARDALWPTSGSMML